METTVYLALANIGNELNIGVGVEAIAKAAVHVGCFKWPAREALRARFAWQRATGVLRLPWRKMRRVYLWFDQSALQLL